MAVGGDDEASGDVAAEKRDARGVAAVAHGQGAAGVGNVLGIGERGLRTEGDIRKIDAVPREGLGGRRRDAAAIRHRRIDDLHIAVAVGLDAEVRRGVAADHVDLGHDRAAARDE